MIVGGESRQYKREKNLYRIWTVLKTSISDLDFFLGRKVTPTLLVVFSDPDLSIWEGVEGGGGVGEVRLGEEEGDDRIII